MQPQVLDWFPGFTAESLFQRYHTYHLVAAGAQAYLTSLGTSTVVGRRILAPQRLEFSLRTFALPLDQHHQAQGGGQQIFPFLLMHGALAAPVEVHMSPQIVQQASPLIEQLLLPDDMEDVSQQGTNGGVPVISLVDRQAVLRQLRRTRKYADMVFKELCVCCY